jgi:Holliday junction resolvase-like predicted endonuclease
MPETSEGGNIGVRHGAWGENVAVALLRAKGYDIIARNVRPCVRDRRLELDIVAYERATGVLVFVEVKQHARHARGESRLRGVDRCKRRNVCRACASWRLRNGWQGSYRFDVIEIYGTPEDDAPEIDHIERVALFTARDRRVSWC